MINEGKVMIGQVSEKKVGLQRNGKWKEFNRQAVLIAEGNYLQDLKHGQWKQYYETGELLIRESYQKGVLHGEYCAYYSNGQVMSIGHYVHGKREGWFNVFTEGGLPLKKMLFVDNILLEEVQLVEAK